MTKTLQLLGGTTAQNDAFTGAAREVTVDTQTHELRVHDGSTAGGFIIPTKSETQRPLGGGTAGTLLTNSGTSGTVNATSIDATPADGSNNPVASNGVYDALALKANTSLSNLTDTGANIANWSHNVTNCITEIPQDIKLELNNGTLTLKSGSKLYVPNGSGVFDTITVASDTTNAFSWMGTYSCMLFYKTNTNSIDASSVGYISSGSSFPSGAGDGWVCYRTDENKVYRHNGSNWENILGLPLGIVTGSGSGVASIDQVFNGFGYIGSAIFVLPGVKGLMCNGRNTDGTLNNTEVTFANVIVSDDHASQSDRCVIMWRNDGSLFTSPVRYYNEKENYIINKNTNAHEVGVIVGTCNRGTDGKVSDFVSKPAFHAVDYSDTEFIGRQAMPSNKYVNLTLGASGSSYTAPADGWFVLVKEATAQYQYANMSGAGGMEMGATAFGSQYLYALLPASKGSSISIYYTAAGSTVKFRFIYANGAA